LVSKSNQMAAKKSTIEQKSKKLESVFTPWFDLQFNPWTKMQQLALAILIFTVGFLLYANTIHHGYVLDDTGAIEQNLNVQKGLAGIPEIMKMDLWQFSDVKLGYYRPLSLITFAIEWEYFGKAPHVSHFNNVWLFALSGVFLFLTLGLIFNKYNKWLALIVTLLFVAHPIHTEVVANIKSRDEILSFLNLMIVLFCTVKQIQTGKWLLIVPVFIFAYLGMLSKETALTGLLLVPFLYFLLSGKTIVQSILISLPILIAVVLFFTQKKMALGTLEASIPIDIINYPYVPPHVGPSIKFSMAFYFLSYGIQLMTFPINLRYDYSYNQVPAVGFGNLYAFIGLILAISLVYFAIKYFFKRDIKSVPLSIFLVSILPGLGFTVFRGGIFAERFLFTALLGFVLFVFILANDFIKSKNWGELNLGFSKNHLVFSGIFALILGLYSFKTIDRNKVWADNYILFSTDLKTGQNSAQNQRHFAEQSLVKAMETKDSVAKEKYLKQSLKAFDISLKMHPKFAESYLKVAVIYQLFLNKPDSAIINYKKAIDCEPTAKLRSEAYFNLGTVYQNNKGNLKYASWCYNQALAYAPDYKPAEDAHNNLKKIGIDSQLEPLADPVDENSPRNDADYFFRLGYTQASNGEYKKAIGTFEKVLSMNPSHLDVLLNIANCHGMLGEYAKSIEYNNTIIRLYPNEKRAWRNNAINYEKIGDKVNMKRCLDKMNSMP